MKKLSFIEAIKLLTPAQKTMNDIESLMETDADAVSQAQIEDFKSRKKRLSTRILQIFTLFHKIN